MNEQRRKQLREIEQRLKRVIDRTTSIFEEIKEEVGTLRADLDQAKDDEQEGFDNLPEGLQQGDKGQAMEAAIEYIED